MTTLMCLLMAVLPPPCRSAGLAVRPVADIWALGLNCRLAPEVRGLVVNTGDNLYDAAGRRQLLKKPVARLQDAASLGATTYFAADGALWRLEKDGAAAKLGSLSLEGIRLAGLDETLYLSGADGRRAGIFAWRPGKGHRQILSLDEAPDCLVASSGRLYFTVRGAVYSFRAGGNVVQLGILASMVRIEGLAVEAKRALLWVSDGRSVAALDLKRDRVVQVLPRGGGSLALRCGNLFVLSRKRQSLLMAKAPGRALEGGKLRLEPLVAPDQ